MKLINSKNLINQRVKNTRSRRSPYLGYVKDLFTHSFKHPWGIFKGKVVRGYFPHPEKGIAQKLFFKSLLDVGFKRTRWQLILPGQTAGVVKRVPPNEDGANEYHVRFYADGMIDCEIEYHRFHIRHWSGPRKKEKTLLNGILAGLSDIPSDTQSEIVSLFKDNEYLVCEVKDQKTA